ncbi:MAG: Uma2 family endonuclease [Chamaesiphon sp.]|nr:Uma2 family endonuclease [Chamaesiphon sp.]
MQSLEIKPLLVDTSRITLRRINHAEFEQLCQDNPDLRLELTATGELVTMAPAGLESSGRNFSLAFQVAKWIESTQLGKGFDSSGGFTLPSGAVRSPDVTWIENSKAENISFDDTFPLLVPDFVIELRSKTDSLKTLQAKMVEYRTNGVRLGWLINPQKQQVEIYRLGQEVEVLQSPTSLSGEDVLSGFVLDLSTIW